MSNATRVEVQKRRQHVGGSFGASGKAPLKQYGDHDPEIKRVWQQERTGQTTTEQFTEENYGQSGIQRVRKYVEDKAAEADRAMQAYAQDTYVGQGVRNVAVHGANYTRKKTKAGVAGKVWSKAKVTTANAWIVPWVLFWYVVFQLPMAVVSTLGIGLAGYIYSVVSSFVESYALGEVVYLFFSQLGKDILFVTDKVVSVALSLFGIEFDPFVLFAIPFILTFALGVLQLLLCWFVYSLAGIKSLSGQAASAKVGLFVAAAIGICIPVLNLFPLILFWTILVWVKPR